MISWFDKSDTCCNWEGCLSPCATIWAGSVHHRVRFWYSLDFFSTCSSDRQLSPGKWSPTRPQMWSLCFWVDTCDTFPTFKGPKICEGLIGEKNEKELFLPCLWHLSSYQIQNTSPFCKSSKSLINLFSYIDHQWFWRWAIFVNVIFRQRSVFNFNCFTTLSNWVDSQYSVCTFEYLAKTYRYQ